MSAGESKELIAAAADHMEALNNIETQLRTFTSGMRVNVYMMRLMLAPVVYMQ